MATRTLDRWWCPHCCMTLSKKTFKQHQRLYFDADSQQWIKKRSTPKAVLDEEMECMLEAVDSEVSPTGSEDDEAATESSPPPPIASFEERQCDQGLDIGDELPLGTRNDGTNSGKETQVEESDITENVGNATGMEEVWDDDEDQALEDFSLETNQPTLASRFEQTVQQKLVRWLVIFLLTLRAYHFVPDVVISLLAKFLKRYFAVVGQHSDFASEMAECMPSSICQLERFIQYERGNYGKYVVCPDCMSLYENQECTTFSGTVIKSKKCPYREFASQRTCSVDLLKQVRLPNGRQRLYPKLVYCYYGVMKGLRNLLLIPGFFEHCELWRSRTRHPERYEDVYDGRIWSDFMTVDGQPFLADPYNFAFTLNVDWFNPFKLSIYSVGAVYLSIMNLPRVERFKRENNILVSLIPGPSEPSYHINSFLKPLVNEFVSLWAGVQMAVMVSGKKLQQVVRAALLCIACDMPGGRKCCGFLAHSANLGCPRCLKEFPGSVGEKDYSGFQRDTWCPRTLQSHKSHIAEILHSKSKTQKSSLESKYGCRYSELLRLPYFDPIKMLIVDLMHNLFLGTAKHVFKNIWLKRGLLSAENLSTLQTRVDSVCVPPNIGRIPRKISSQFASLIADKWKNWTNYYSVMCLYDIIPQQHLECWRHFVLACRYLCQHTITLTDIKIADALLLQFCRRCEVLYGKSCITPNMHMHAHLRECLQDFGPVYGFWLFSFERYNGILGHQPTNNRCVEIQLLERFLEDNFIYSSELPDQFLNDFSDIFPQTYPTTLEPQHQAGEHENWSYTNLSDLKLPKKSLIVALTSSMKDQVQRLYQTLYPDQTIESDTIPSIVLQYPSITINGCVYGSKLAHQQSSIVMVNWNASFMGPHKKYANIPVTTSFQRHPVLVHHYAKHTLTIDDSTITHLFAIVSWLLPHPNHGCLGKPVTVWCNDLFDTCNFNVIPVQLLSSVCLYTKDVLHGERVLLVAPLVNT